MKITNRLVSRKMRLHIPHLLGLMLLLVVGVCFFVTLFTITIRYEETAEQYFDDYFYADVTFYGSFDEKSVELLSNLQGVRLAKGRNVRDFREEELIIRAISLTDGLNVPYLYEGRMPGNENECLLLRRNALALGLGLGDKITIGGKTLTITGLAASNEYIYMVQSERTLMAQPDRFGVVFVKSGFFPVGYNEIVLITGDEFSFDQALELVQAFRGTLRKDQLSHTLYRADLDEIRSFAYIFPVIFAILITIVIYVMLSRTIQKERRQIGTMKALGVTNAKIISIYLSQFSIAAFLGALIGCFTAVFMCDIIVGIMSSMFEVPTLTFAFYPVLWFMAIIVSVLLCMISGLIALVSILSLLPAHLMRPRLPKGGKRILLEYAGFLWKAFSFNTRYTLKNAMRNKGRFFAVVLGMCGSCALLAFSLGFHDSIINTQNKYFDEYANYDVVVDFDLTPLEFTHPAINQMNEGSKALVVPVDIEDEIYILVISESDFDMVFIPGEALLDGIIIPEYFAHRWAVDVGDNLKINEYNAVISAIVPQHLGLTLYTSFDYINTITDEVPPVYNTVYGRSADMRNLIQYLKENDLDFATIDDDKTSFDSIMDSITVLIWFMIGCSVVLGFTVLYSVGLINLSAREYEYMFMGVMGYPHKKILLAHIKETILQLVFAIPLGFLLGNVLLELIKEEFSNNNFVIAAAIYPNSYLISALAVIAITAVMALVTSGHIEKLDIVEGLKAQDD